MCKQHSSRSLNTSWHSIEVDTVATFLQDISCPDLQFEATQSRTNIAQRASRERGAFPIHVQLLASQNNNVNEQTPPAVCIFYALGSSRHSAASRRPFSLLLRQQRDLYQLCHGRSPLCLGLHISDGDCFPLFSACFRTDETSQRVAVRTAPLQSSSQLVTPSGVSCVCFIYNPEHSTKAVALMCTHSVVLASRGTRTTWQSSCVPTFCVQGV